MWTSDTQKLNVIKCHEFYVCRCSQCCSNTKASSEKFMCVCGVSLCQNLLLLRNWIFHVKRENKTNFLVFCVFGCFVRCIERFSLSVHRKLALCNEHEVLVFLGSCCFRFYYCIFFRVFCCCVCCCFLLRIQSSVLGTLTFQVMQRFSLKTVKYYSTIMAWQQSSWQFSFFPSLCYSNFMQFFLLKLSSMLLFPNLRINY